MKIEIFDEIGPLTVVNITLYGPKNPDGTLQTHGREFRIPDDAVKKLKALYTQDNANGTTKLYDFIMKQVNESNPVTVISLGAAPKLDSAGKPIDPINDSELDFKV